MDQGLVDGVRRRDADAWAAMHRATVPSLEASARRHVRDEHDAADVVAEVFARAWTAIDRYEPDRPMVAWLHGIQRNVLHERGRRLRRDAPWPACADAIIDEDADPATHVMRAEASSDVVAALRTLDMNARRIVYLRVVERMPAYEVGVLVGASAAAVRVAQTRALRRARAAITAIGR